MMDQSPLVSVIIPCYNNYNEPYLRECFNSIKQQTYSNIEVIVIDDGSENKASDLLIKLGEEYHFIFEKQVNKGISGALNTGIRNHAKGKYIAMMGSDDYWVSSKIETQVKYMESINDKIAACCTWGYFIYENDVSKPTPRLTKLLKSTDLTFSALLKFNNIMQISVMIRANVFKEIGLFDERSVVEDWDMWLRITDRYEFGYIPEPLVYYRRHSDNLSNYFEKLYNSMKYILNKWKEKEGQKQSLNHVEITAINYFARDRKLKALKIALANFQCADKRLYWRGILKIFVPKFLYIKK